MFPFMNNFMLISFLKKQPKQKQKISKPHKVQKKTTHNQILTFILTNFKKIRKTSFIGNKFKLHAT
jgi:hypothetical protein